MNWLHCKLNDISDKKYDEIYLSLSQSRKTHVDQMKKIESKKRSLLATYLLGQLIDGEGLNNVVIENDESGKAYINRDDYFISISHSKEMVACAIDNKPIGIDVEKIRPINKKLIEYVCTHQEKEYVMNNNSNVENLNNKFFEIWTAKEAYFKKHNKPFNIRQIETLNISKKQFIIQGYYITIL